MPDFVDENPVTLGLEFYASEAGHVTGVRFYKGPSNIGTHVGYLYDIGGTLLGSVTFTGETSTGWQEMLFSTPISISAATRYIVAYYSPQKAYSYNFGYYSTASRTNGPLTAPNGANATACSDGTGNGRYGYGAGLTFPNNTYNNTNYWVDVIFETSAVGISGDFAATESGSDSAVLSASVFVGGDMAGTESGADSVAASGAVEVSGSVAATETGSESASGSGVVDVVGSLSASETGPDSLGMGGGVANAGTMSAQEAGADSFMASGGLYVPDAYAALSTRASRLTALATMAALTTHISTGASRVN